MTYFPKCSSWLKALKLFVPTDIALLTVPSMLCWIAFLSMGIILSLQVEESTPIVIFFLAETGMWFLATFAFYWLMIAGYLFGLKLLWSSPPKWLLPPQKNSSKLLHTSIVIISTLPIAIVFALYFIHATSVKGFLLLTKDISTESLIDLLTNCSFKLSWLWMISAAYLYELVELCTQKMAKKLND